MIIIPVLITLTACFIFYSTSRRAVYRRKLLNKWFLHRPVFSKLVALGLLAIAFVLFIALQGAGVGTFLGLVTLMTAYGYILLFYPLERCVRT